MLAGNADVHDGVGGHAAVSASLTLSCCCEQTPVAKSGACPGRSVFPAQQNGIHRMPNRLFQTSNEDTQ